MLIANFGRGVKYFWAGYHAFYADKSLWRYAAMPLGALLLLYFGVAVGIGYVFFQLSEQLNQALGKLPWYLSWLPTGLNGLALLLGLLLVLLLLSTTLTTFYEFLGGYFFDALVEKYEQKKYKRFPPAWQWGFELKNSGDLLRYGLRSALTFLILLVASALIPVVGPVLLILIMGYMTGVSYLAGSSHNRTWRFALLRQKIRPHWAVVLGYGVTTYLLLMIPLGGIFLLPAIVLGGSELLNGELPLPTTELTTRPK